ncbi:MAG: ABC transporter permease [Saprospiraceae bacterium]
MIRFILKRILVSVPIMLLAVLVSFYLIHAVHSDYNQSDSDSKISKSKKGFFSEVKDLPTFYWSVFPANFPDTLNNIIDEKLRKRITSHLYNGNTIDKITYFLKSEKELFSLLDENNTAIQESILSLSQGNEIKKIILQLPDSIKKKGEYITWMNNLNILIKDEKLWRLAIPSLHWNGASNQFHLWVKKIATGDWGKSMVDNKPIWIKIREALTWTFTLNLLGLFIVFLSGLFIGEYLFINKNHLISKVMEALLFLFYSLPIFFLGLILIYLFASDIVSTKMHILPTPGFIDISTDKSVLQNMLQYSSALVLPMTCMVLPSLAYMSILIAKKLSAESVKPYSFSLWVEGKSWQEITSKHLRKNIVFPLLALIAMEIPALISGSLVIEILFNIPGMGRLMYQSIILQDWMVVLYILVLVSLITIVGKIIADAFMFIFDNRVKLQ